MRSFIEGNVLMLRNFGQIKLGDLVFALSVEPAPKAAAKQK